MTVIDPRLPQSAFDRVAAGALPRSLFDDLALGLLLSLGVLIVLTFSNYGIIWDEEVQRTYGLLLLDYYGSGLRDLSAFGYDNLYLYGGGFDMAAALLERVSPVGAYETRHLLGGMVGLLGMAGTWRLARLVGGERTGFLALLLLALLPAYYGHMFSNPKDIPFACGMVWCLHLSALILRELPRPRWGLVLGFGIVLGLTLGTRIGGVLAVFFLGAAVLGHLGRVAALRRGIAPAGRQAVTIALRLLPALPVAWLVMVLVWPWAHLDFLNPVRAFLKFSAFPWPNEVLYGGRWIPADELPATYLPTMLGLQLPELLLAGLVAAAWYGFRALVRPPLAVDGTRRLQVGLVALAAVFPVAYALASHPVLYNGFRHFLFVLPPLAIVAALGFDRLWAAVADNRSRLRARLLALPFTAAVVAQVWTMAALHPYEYVYYNRIAGGIAGAEWRYELDYWGAALREAALALDEYVANERGGRIGTAERVRVFVCGHPTSAMYFLPPQFRLVGEPEQADFLVSWTQAGCNFTMFGQVVAEVQRFGVTLAVVKDLRE
ncbi:glycosyltransferase family 39 protein [Skermanella rosea]|uniref:glycosyltransferase family 39 protein n=1 Tax=Skermanella rosea TaxID=1817965 RepID=UPI0019339AAB|nr:glycosyltransferase family 39 protein [Skermanella rosea]UEM02519.1 glycosyltransferase family 39 protein [Skermanella rosea]